MTVTVTDVYGGAKHVFRGEPDQVWQQLRLEYTWLARPSRFGTESTLQGDISKLTHAQAYFVKVEE